MSIVSDASKCPAGAAFTLSLCATRILGLVPLLASAREFPYAAGAVGRRFLMSILDGVSLLLAVALFVYLMAALLRADRG
ncbi:K(+)-transporting ATPase subunit F [Pseudomonas huaxiensis]|uniref:K(+)-transporting ATPase subunit F n=1 Tax=Pseudomonas huaxiensis TaxID=2213017 RepID=UPI001CDD307B|nr:K(+)-transporting ATPase subunit F [Pseudomonas huaxiensis]